MEKTAIFEMQNAWTFLKAEELGQSCGKWNHAST